MQIEVPHEVTYQFDGKASIADVARSLLAQERLIRDAFDVLEMCFPDLQFESIVISVRDISQHSPLRELLQVIVVTSYQEELGKEVPLLIQNLLGVQLSDKYDGLITVLVLCIAIYGLNWVADKVFKGKPKPELVNERARLLKRAAHLANLPADQIEEAIQSRLSGGRRRSVMKAASDFILPAKRHRATAITGLGGEAVSEAAITAAPSDIELAEYEPDSEDYTIEDVVIKFHRHDIDKTKDWAATVDVISKHRKTLHIDPMINADRLFERKAVRGDVLVTSERNSQGDYVPVLYRLVRVYEDVG